MFLFEERRASPSITLLGPEDIRIHANSPFITCKTESRSVPVSMNQHHGQVYEHISLIRGRPSLWVPAAPIAVQADSQECLQESLTLCDSVTAAIDEGTLCSKPSSKAWRRRQDTSACCARRVDRTLTPHQWSQTKCFAITVVWALPRRPHGIQPSAFYGNHLEFFFVLFLCCAFRAFEDQKLSKEIVKGTNGNIISEMDPGYIFVAQEGERSDYIEQDGHSRGTTAIFLRLSAARLHVHKQHSHVQIHTHTHTYFNSNINLIILSCLDPAFHTPNPSRKPSQ